ncbi:restriction endonuclease [bacterium]|nr:restriction endonuclease [bacterium]
MKLVELNDNDVDDILQKFYSSFDGGYEFEQFLKIYLESIGLDEIEVTQKSSDGGLDLKAIKKGIDELTDLDSIKYYIQAKRYNPHSSVSLESIRALRGILPDGYKGIYITTGKFSKQAYEFAAQNESRALILIDGKKLITSCIEKGLGFRLKPVFFDNDIKHLINKEIKSEPLRKDSITKQYIKKQVSENDIRARILRIPKSISENISEIETSSFIKFGNEKPEKFNIDKTKTYFGGVTDIFKRFGLLDNEGNRYSKDAYWFFDENNKILEIEFEK